MGLINRFSDSAPDLKHAMKPWQGLLKKANTFMWGAEHGKAFEDVKAIIMNPNGPVLRHFDPQLPIQLLSDASWTGLRLCLVQIAEGCKDPLLITAGSRFQAPGRTTTL